MSNSIPTSEELIEKLENKVSTLNQKSEKFSAEIVSRLLPEATLQNNQYIIEPHFQYDLKTNDWKDDKVKGSGLVSLISHINGYDIDNFDGKLSACAELGAQIEFAKKKLRERRDSRRGKPTEKYVYTDGKGNEAYEMHTWSSGLKRPYYKEEYVEDIDIVPNISCYNFNKIAQRERANILIFMDEKTCDRVEQELFKRNENVVCTVIPKIFFPRLKKAGFMDFLGIRARCAIVPNFTTASRHEALLLGQLILRLNAFSDQHIPVTIVDDINAKPNEETIGKWRCSKEKLKIYMETGLKKGNRWLLNAYAMRVDDLKEEDNKIKNQLKEEAIIREEGRGFMSLGFWQMPDARRTTLYYVYSNINQRVHTLKPRSAQISLTEILGASKAEASFGKIRNKQGIDWNSVMMNMITNCSAIGYFNPETKIKSLGCWHIKYKNNESFCVHLGKQAIVKNKGEKVAFYTSLSHLTANNDGGFIFESQETHADFESSMPMTYEMRTKYIEICEYLKYVQDYRLCARLIVGWVILAPFAGLLDWRPHMCLVGSAHVGKSWILRHIIKAGIRWMAFDLSGTQGTTEAGIRRGLTHGSRPIVMDEGGDESKSKKHDEWIQEIMILLRAASTDDAGTGVMGDGSVFDIRSMAIYAGIDSHITEHADARRWHCIEFRDTPRQKISRDEHFYNLEEMVSQMGADFSQELFQWTFLNIEKILDWIKVFKRSKVFEGNVWIADQFAPLLAASYCFELSDDMLETMIPYVDEADDYMQFFPIMDFIEGVSLQDSEENKLLIRILSHSVYINPKDRYTVGEIIEMAVALDTGDISFSMIRRYSTDYSEEYSEEAKVDSARRNMQRNVDEMHRLGIKVSTNKNCVQFANRSEAMEKFLRGYYGDRDMSGFISRTLGRIEGAYKGDPVYFKGYSCRATYIPLDIILRLCGLAGQLSG